MKNSLHRPLRTSTLALLTFIVALLAGCQSWIEPSKTQVKQNEQGIEGLHEIARRLSSLEQAVTKDPEASGKRIKALEERLVESEQRVKQVAEEANTKNEKLKQRVAEAAGDLAQIAGAFTGLGPLVPGLLANVKTSLESTATKAAANATADTEKQIAALKSELQAREELRRKDLEMARHELASLSAQQKADLQRELVAQAKAVGIEGAEKMSLEELLAALGAGGLSVAALVRTFGRSRSQGEIDQLWDKQEELKTLVAQKLAVRPGDRVV